MRWRCAVVTLSCLQICVVSVARGQAVERPLPVDSNVTIGQLENGLRFYIRKRRKLKELDSVADPLSLDDL